MTTSILLTGTPSINPTELVEFLKFGQFGAALAMLILGFYLHWQASHSDALIEQRKSVARQFMNYAIILFALCAVGEIVNTFVPRPDRSVTATLMVPPLDELNSKEYGDVQILSRYGNAKPEKKPALEEGQSFEVHHGTTFLISLKGLTDKLARMKLNKQSLESTLTKETPSIGPGGPK